MTDKRDTMLEWINDRLSKLLDFPVPQDLTEYILAIENARDLEDYLKTLLDFNNPQHNQFFFELLQKRQERLGSMCDVQGYKKSEVEESYILPKQNEKKKKGKGQAQAQVVTNENSVVQKETTDKKKKSKYVNLYSQEGQMKDVILLKGRHHCDCQASKHKLVNNCLKCGRIVCEQEGSGPCLFCNNLGMELIAGLFVLVLAITSSTVSANTVCAPKKYGVGRMVCVCNATYCDTVDPVTALPAGQYLLYTSSKEGLRFKEANGTFNENSSSIGAHFKINSSVTYQTIIGFGGAFTDAAGVDIGFLSPAAQDHLLSSYYSPEGIEYNMGRVPIAGCDFSTRTYTYDDVENDINLTHFNLTTEDFTYKIPLIKRVQQMSQKQLKLLTAAWTAPPWMKTNNDYSGFGFLKEEYYQEWANYLIKFLDTYKKEDIEFWGISTGNEPSNGIIPINRFNSMGWTPQSQRKWVAENFGPVLRSSQHANIKLLALDDQRFMLPWWIDLVMSNERAAEYIDGIAVHWYWDTLLPSSLLDLTHNNFPSKFIISSEASVGDKPWDLDKVKLGSWNRGESYMADIMQNLNHWVSGWIDWNLALNLQGGPNWAKNYVDAAIIVNTTADEFYKQPMFYAIGHFSKFIPEGSVRISVEPQNQKGVEIVAFHTPDNAMAIVLYNERDSKCRIILEDSSRGFIELTLAKRSFNTIIYW